MTFWVIALLMTLAVAATLLRPLLRTPARPAEAEVETPDMALYRAQLAEVDRDRARGLLPEAEVEAARAEVARRLLAAARSTPEAAPNRARQPLLAGALLALLLALTVGVYTLLGAPLYPDLPIAARLDASEARRESRPSQDQAEAAAPALPAPQVEESYRQTVAQLREIVPTRPEDLRGWELLAFHEGQLRNFAAAADAQERVVALKGAEAEAGDLRLWLDFLVVAAGDYVSPEAERVAGALLDRNPDDPVALYYLGVLYNQTDRPDLAFRLWRPLVETGDTETFHVMAARARIEDAAFRAGVDYDLPALRGPGAAEIAAAEDMSVEERGEMIRGMVAGLSERLATEGGPASDWARLIRAYGVLGETERARGIWTEAREVFAEAPGAVEMLRTAAEAAGVAGPEDTE